MKNYWFDANWIEKNRISFRTNYIHTLKTYPSLSSITRNEAKSLSQSTWNGALFVHAIWMKWNRYPFEKRYHIWAISRTINYWNPVKWILWKLLERINFPSGPCGVFLVSFYCSELFKMAITSRSFLCFFFGVKLMVFFGSSSINKWLQLIYDSFLWRIVLQLSKIELIYKFKY